MGFTEESSSTPTAPSYGIFYNFVYYMTTPDGTPVKRIVVTNRKGA
tara:strand:- start:46310 stop:46447 length:138 start_codon:yes stop_codon:yes gene_type:complete